MKIPKMTYTKIYFSNLNKWKNVNLVKEAKENKIKCSKIVNNLTYWQPLTKRINKMKKIWLR